MAEFQRIEKDKTFAEEQRKKADAETLRIKDENKKVLAEFQKIQFETLKIKALSDEQRKKADDETLKLKEEKNKTLAEEELHNLNDFENLLIKVD
ncbi:hypothetical protein [Arcobacter caeni]|uniref:Uncharacterized protein n=1 Tax=Arcobacter caeni TaxID=1912877 RepID=A0A363CZG0_9BACT|nr:hypothetical protein [Arcobacter caeni]PUE64373.1 hypothetical protein B0174_07060 [Arcobacter caeni]